MTTDRYDRSKWTIPLGSVFLLIIVVFLIGELMARTAGFGPFDPDGPDISISPKGHFFEIDSTLGYRNRPGKFLITQSDKLVFQATNNGSGLRAIRSFPHGNLPGIWVFGCSFTYGWGVDDGKEFPAVLQEKMPNIKVFNYGVCGYSNYQNLLQLRSELNSENKPQAVVLAYASFHDERNVLSSNYASVLGRFNKLGALNMPYARLQENGLLSEFSVSDLDHNIWPIAKQSAFVNALQQNWRNWNDGKLNAEEVSAVIFHQFDSLCNAYDVEFILANIGDPLKAKQTLERCNSVNLEYVDISVDLEQEGATLLPLDPHPSPRTHHQYALRLSEFLGSR